MNRTVRRMLVVSSLVLLSMAQRSMAQQGQISVNRGGVQQNYVLTPNGAFRVNDDGSTDPVDPASEPALQGINIPNMAGGGNGDGPVISQSNGGGAIGRSFTGPNGNGGNGSNQSAQQMQQQLQQKMRQASDDALKKALGCSDQEWAVLLPKIQKVQALQSAVMPGSKLKAPTGGADTPGSVVQFGARVQDFQKVVTTDNVSDAQLAQRLASVREARDKVKVDLVQARKELTDVVTQRQEAILFQWGILAD
jgi:hypothetical protein